MPHIGMSKMPGLLQSKEMEGSELIWLEALRQKGEAAFEQSGIPTAKTEAWKYTKLRMLNADDFEFPSSEEQTCHCGCHHHDGEDEHCHCEGHDCTCHVDFPFEGYVLRFKNGAFVAPHPKLPEGVEVMTLMKAAHLEEDVKAKLGKLIELDNYPFAALNTAYLEEGLFINIRKGVKLEKPLIIDHLARPQDKNLFWNLRHLIVVENGADAEIIENYRYRGAEKSRYFANIVSEIYVGRNAKLRHYKLQDEAFKACHLALSAVQVKADGNYRHFCAQKGADVGRNEVVVKLVEEGAETRVDAAYKMSGWATLDTTTDIRHLAPHTKSEQLVKGVVDGDAKGVFQGRIHIAPDSQQTEGRQLHQALLLSDRAEVDVKPELEIFADDVKCSHGAASGELDEEQLFYMRSRGIDADEARQILVEAFLDDALMQVEDEAVRIWLKSVLQ